MTDTVEPRTYGNWRRPSSPGIGPLGLAGTMVLLAAMVGTLIALALVGPLGAFVVAVAGGLTILPLYVRVSHGRNGLQAIVARGAYGQAVMRGGTIYRAGPMATIGRGRCGLPGLAASMTAMDAVDSYGRPFAMLHHPRTGHVSVVLSTSPDGASLVDGSQVERWVSHWGSWLAGLSHEAALVGASVTIESAPDSGHRLRREVESNLSPTAPPLAAQVLAQIVNTYPAGSATMTSRVALTFTMDRRHAGGRRTLDEMIADIGQRLPSLAAELGSTGAGPARAMTVDELAAAIRVAYDPASASTADQFGLAHAGVDWADCGPTAADESWDYYRHDSGVSVTWAMHEAPRGVVFPNVLERLVAPHRDIDRKRVTLLYRPHDPAAATKAVERDHKDALFAANSRTGPIHARDSVAVRMATQTAAEEATGAGVTRFAILVTATVLESVKLSAAAAAVDSMATTSRMRMRRVYGSQATAFLGALPLGLVLPAHLRVPQAIRESM